MENVAFAFVLMAVSAALALHLGSRAGKSKTFIYASGLAIMLLQIAVLFTVRDWSSSAGSAMGQAQTSGHPGHLLRSL